MIKLGSESDYVERYRELMVLEEISDDCVGLAEKARRFGDLRPDIAAPLERFAGAMIHLLDAHLGQHLVVRRDAVRLYEDMLAHRDASPGRNGTRSSDASPFQPRPTPRGGDIPTR